MTKNLLLLLFIFQQLHTLAQQSPKLLVDKIIGRIDQHIILQSDIDPDLKKSTGLVQNEQYCFSFKQMLQQKLLLAQAEKDSLKISEEEVETELDAIVRYYLGLYGQKGLEEIAGKSIYEIKNDHRLAIHEKLLSELAYRHLTESVQVTPAEVKSYFDRIPKDSLPFYQSMLQVKQIVLHAKSNPALEQYDKEELSTYKRMVESGEITFEKLAQLHNEDDNLKNKSNLLSFHRNDQNIESNVKLAAFTLKEQQISQPIKIKKGYCLIELISRNGDEVTIRQVVKRTKCTPLELKQVTTKADSIRSLVIAQTLSFNHAVDQFSEDPEGRFTAGNIVNTSGESSLTIDQLPGDIVAILKQLTAGEISHPIPFTDAQGKQGAKLIYLASATKPHIENLLDDYATIAERVKLEKKKAIIEIWFKTNIDKHYTILDKRYICDLRIDK